MVELGHKIKQFASGQFHMNYMDTTGQLYQLGLEDTDTFKELEQVEKGREASERMHLTPVPVDMTSLEGIQFKKLTCSFKDSYGITEDGFVYKYSF